MTINLLPLLGVLSAQAVVRLSDVVTILAQKVVNKAIWSGDLDPACPTSSELFAQWDKEEQEEKECQHLYAQEVAREGLLLSLKRDPEEGEDKVFIWMGYTPEQETEAEALERKANPPKRRKAWDMGKSERSRCFEYAGSQKKRKRRVKKILNQYC